jgi:hypothetical protein
MSWQAVRAAFNLPPEVDPTARFVAVALAYRAGVDFRAWPSIACIRADTGLSDRAIRYALGRLADADHLRVIPKGGASSTYLLTPAPDAGVTPAPRAATPAPDAAHPGTTCTRNGKGTDQEHAPTVSSAMRTAGAGHGNGTDTGVVIHKGPAPGETWGEYRERGGR